MRGRGLGLAAALVALVLATPGVVSAATRPTAPAKPHPHRAPHTLPVHSGAQPSTAGPVAVATDAAAHIQHLFVIVQEGHTFDNYFATYPGVTGLPTSVTSQTLSQGRSPALPSSVTAAFRAVDGGKMDGFVNDPSLAVTPQAHFDPSLLSGYWALADKGVLMDNYFSAALGGSEPNHMYLFTGRTVTPKQYVDPKGLTIPSIVDRLGAAGASWRVYTQQDPNLPNITSLTYHAAPSNARSAAIARLPLLDMPSVVDNPTNFANIVDRSQLFTDIASGKAPSVSYILPGGDSERAPGSIADGQDRVVGMVNAIASSPLWANSAIVVTWSDWGGWYDGVAPPALDGDGPGLRVPAIILSPYAKAGTVDHQAADHTSILRLIERLHGLAPLSTRDQNASDLLSAFDFSARPLPPIAVGLTAVKTVTVSSHTTNTLLAVYGSIVGAMVVSAVALVAWPRRRRSRRRRLHP